MFNPDGRLIGILEVGGVANLVFAGAHVLHDVISGCAPTLLLNLLRTGLTRSTPHPSHAGSMLVLMQETRLTSIQLKVYGALQGRGDGAPPTPPPPMAPQPVPMPPSTPTGATRTPSRCLGNSMRVPASAALIAAVAACLLSRLELVNY